MVGNINSGAAGGYINNLNKSVKNASKAMSNISTGVKLNKAKDNPANMVISSQMYSQLSGMSRAYQNTQEAYNMFSIAEGGLGGISSALNQMKTLAVGAGNTGINGSGQTGAYQSQMNNLLSTINHLATTTNYGSENLLNGTKSFSAGSIAMDAADPANIINLNQSDADVHTQATGQNDVVVSFSGDTADQAEKASLTSNFGTGTTTLATDQSFSLNGVDGAENFAFAAGTSIEDMVASINASTEDTGVEAFAIDGNTEVRLASTDYGSRQSVSVEQVTGDGFATAGSSASDTGQDLTVSVDGQEFTGDGLSVTVDTQNISGTLQFNPADSDSSTTGVSQGGYGEDTLVDATTARRATVSQPEGTEQLQLGSGAGGSDRDHVSLPNANLSNLGRITVDGESYSLQDLFGGGKASLSVDPDLAQQVIGQAIEDVSGYRADIGAYQSNALDATAKNLEVAMENITAANSAITDTDIAQSVTEMTTQRILQETSLFGIEQTNQMSALRLSLLP